MDLWPLCVLQLRYFPGRTDGLTQSLAEGNSTLANRAAKEAKEPRETAEARTEQVEAQVECLMGCRLLSVDFYRCEEFRFTSLFRGGVTLNAHAFCSTNKVVYCSNGVFFLAVAGTTTARIGGA